MPSARLLLHSIEEGDVLLPAHPALLSDSCSYLVSLDYDGTLLPRHSKVEEIDRQIFTLLERLREHRVRWGINTGRNLRDMATALCALPLQPDFLCTCERYVHLVGADGTWHALSEHNAACYAVNRRLREKVLLAWSELLREIRAALPDAIWHISNTDPLSIEAVDGETMDLLMPLVLAFAQSLPGSTVQRAGKYLRLADARFNKGVALQAVQRAWHLPEHALFIMGDGHNDLDAFRTFPRAACAAPLSAHTDVLRWISTHYGTTYPSVADALKACVLPRFSERNRESS